MLLPGRDYLQVRVVVSEVRLLRECYRKETSLPAIVTGTG